MTELPIMAKHASAIARAADDLSSKLKDIALHSEELNTSIDPSIYAMTIFILACFVGYYVVWKVTPALHTPLMALTNAISGIIIIGSMLASSPTDFGLSSLLGYLATFLAAINIFGGFVVTERMLGMFKKK